jgi:hypothetical protein
MKTLIVIAWIVFTGCSYAQQTANINFDAKISKQLWNEFNKNEQILLLKKYPSIEIIPSENIGLIQSAQVANRSTQSTNGGAILGSAIGQAAYIDRSFSGSSNNYSATTHLGVGILGGMLGSALDQKAETKFVINYGVKTLDGQIHEIRIDSLDEFTKPIGQCVHIPNLEPASSLLCNDTKLQLLKRLSALSTIPTDALVIRESSGINIKCIVPGIGMMTLDRNACLQMEGKIEK